MSDLISRSMYRSKLMKALDVLNKEYREAMLNEDNDLILAIQNQQSAYMIALRLLDNEPTAYDIDKVVEELNQRKIKLLSYAEDYEKTGDFEQAEIYSQIAIEYITAIEIVKQGGVSDDVCEWKGKEKEYIQNPHTKRLYSNEESTENVYCNTCGKKIKVVE